MEAEYHALRAQTLVRFPGTIFCEVLQMKDKHYFEIFRVFMRLGFTAFGGPAAHVSMMEDELVEKRKWLSKEKFVDMFGLTSLIPGPNSTEMAIFLGYDRGGIPGLIIAGLSFIVPAMILVLIFTYLYVTYGTIPAVSNVLDGIKPVIIAIIFNALIKLIPNVIKRKPFYLAVFIGTFVLSLLGVSELILIFSVGLFVFATNMILERQKQNKLLAVEPVSLLILFLTFLKIGSILYGSGYVLLAFLESEFVQGLEVLTQGQLIDAVAIGQLLPGPVFTTSASIGYILRGVPGALVSTAGIFLPSFFLVALLNPILHKLRESQKLKFLLDGINLASLALMASVLVRLFQSSITDIPTAIVGLISLIALVRFKINTTYLILFGAAFGYFFI